MNDYIVHLKSMRVQAESYELARNKAKKKLAGGFAFPNMMIKDVEKSEFNE